MTEAQSKAACERSVTAKLLPGRKYALQHLGRVLVLGLGKSGQAVVEFCAPLVGSRVDELVIAAGERTPEREAFAYTHAVEGVRFLFNHEQIKGSYDICIVSPGIPATSNFYRSAQRASAELISEIEFAWRESRCTDRWVAVTGTNGKTTTTALITQLLIAAGKKAIAIGNIGDAALGAVAHDAADIYVAEASSYQLASINRFAPDVAVLLSITPDHLDWHGSFEAYCAAKLALLTHLNEVPGAAAIFDAHDTSLQEAFSMLSQSLSQEKDFVRIAVRVTRDIDARIAHCCNGNAAFIDDGWLYVKLNGTSYRLMRADDLAIKGDHNLVNALAAASAALVLRADEAAIARGLSEFAPLEHRVEPCGKVRGITFINDSKATNTDASIKALSSFPKKRVIALLGGCDKGTDLASLVSTARIYAKAVVCFGDAKERFVAAFLSEPSSLGSSSEGVDTKVINIADNQSFTYDETGLVVACATSLTDACALACSLAQTGDVVLLSPACSSFDEFSCYEERGSRFKAFVAQYANRMGV